MQSEANPTFFQFLGSSKIDANDIVGSNYVIDESSFIFQTSGEEALCKKSNIICEISKDAMRLFDSRAFGSN